MEIKDSPLLESFFLKNNFLNFPNFGMMKNPKIKTRQPYSEKPCKGMSKTTWTQEIRRSHQDDSR